ncbi:MAG: hypothetical protein QUS33_14645 [Dehalococcoidia bacterium]|nr:hypothetical protein [Dehalococcoidia bacterium]
MGSYKARADVTKNRLYIVLDGFLTDLQARECADLTIAECRKLRPGFDVITDITTAQPSTAKGAEDLLRAMIFLKEHGMGRPIRVMQNPKEMTLGSHQMTRKSKEAGYDVNMAASVEEAEEMLGDRRET